MTELHPAVIEAAADLLDDHDRRTGRPAHPQVSPGVSPDGDTEDEGPPWERFTLADLAANPPKACGWLFRQLWPADAYGIVAAESKAGKTWIMADALVTVAAGVPFLGRFPVDTSGPVLAFLGEGGRRNIWRRLRAVCEFHGIDPAAIGDRIALVDRAPQLRRSDHLGRMALDVAEHRPVLVVLDPLYLSLGGASMAQLGEVGDILRRPQEIAQDGGAALIVAHHWNRNTAASGIDRMSGAGPAEWGRVLWSAEVVRRADDPDHPTGSLVSLNVTVRGSELADVDFGLTRRVWATNPDDLASPMGYEVAAGDAHAKGATSTGSALERIAEVLATDPERWWTVDEVQDGTARQADDDPQLAPLKRDTVRKKLADLADAAKVERDGSRGGAGGGGGHVYRLVAR